MNTKGEFINHRQLSWMTCTIIISGGLITFPRELVRLSGHDAWACFLLPLVYSLVLALFFRMMMNQRPGHHLFGIITDAFGKIIGSIFNSVLLLYFWMLLMRDISALSHFLNSTILLTTPQEMIILLFGLTLMYYGKLGIEPIARVNDLSLPFLILWLVLLPIALSGDINTKSILPAFSVPARYFWYGNLINIGWFGDILVMGAFLHSIRQARITHAYMRHGIIIGTVLLAVLVFLNLTVMGTGIAGRVLFPNYILVEQIQITDFMDRLETVVYVLWFPLYLAKTATTAIALKIGISHYVGDGNYRYFTIPASWLVIVTAIFAFSSVTELANFIGYSLTLIVVVLVTPIILLAVARMTLFAGNRRQATSRTKHKKKRNGSHSAWYYSTNILVVAYGLTIAAGFYFSLDYPAVGTAAAIALGVILFSAIGTSFMETRVKRKETKEPNPG